MRSPRPPESGNLLDGLQQLLRRGRGVADLDESPRGDGQQGGVVADAGGVHPGMLGPRRGRDVGVLERGDDPVGVGAEASGDPPLGVRLRQRQALLVERLLEGAGGVHVALGADHRPQGGQAAGGMVGVEDTSPLSSNRW